MVFTLEFPGAPEESTAGRSSPGKGRVGAVAEAQLATLSHTPQARRGCHPRRSEVIAGVRSLGRGLR